MGEAVPTGRRAAAGGEDTVTSGVAAGTAGGGGGRGPNPPGVSCWKGGEPLQEGSLLCVCMCARVSMHVCAECAYVCTRVHCMPTCAHACVQSVRMCVHLYLCVPVYTACLRLHGYPYAYVFTVPIRACACLCTCVYMPVCARVYVSYTCICENYMSLYMYIQTGDHTLPVFMCVWHVRMSVYMSVRVYGCAHPLLVFM